MARATLLRCTLLYGATGCVTLIATALPAPFTTLFRTPFSRRIAAPGTSTLLGFSRGPIGATVGSALSGAFCSPVCGAICLLRCGRCLGIGATARSGLRFARWALSAIAAAPLAPLIA